MWALLSAILFVFDVLYSSAHYLSLFIVLEVYYNYHHICNTWLHAGAVGCSSELLLLCPMCSTYVLLRMYIHIADFSKQSLLLPTSTSATTTTDSPS